jgi:hypothetical protein
MIWLRGWELCQKNNCDEGSCIVQSQSQLRFWAQSLRSDPRSIYALRTLLSTQAVGRGPGVLSDDAVLRGFIQLMLQGRFHIHGQPSFTKISEENKPKPRVSIPGFDPPASSSKAPPSSSKSSQPDDPATLPPNNDPSAQAAALTAAANSGAALCAVCSA